MFNPLPKLRWLVEPSFAIIFFALWIVAEIGRSGGAPWPSFPFTVGLLAASIGVARSFPRVALALTGIVLVVQLFVPSTRFIGTTWPIYLAVLITCLIISATAAGRVRWLSLPATAGYFILITGLMTIPSLSDGYGLASWAGVGLPEAHIVGNFLAVLLPSLVSTAAAWFIGFGFRASRLKRASDIKLGEAEGELRSAEIDLIITRERDRIAQDVHDIMAHSLAVIIAQADGARFIGPSRPGVVNESLERIAASARASLSEVRMLIESLVDDPEGHSNPTLANLDDLVLRMSGAGLSATVTQFGEQVTLTASQELAVYRIVQEGLTNALKHAGAGPTARVTMDWRGPGLALTIESSGTPPQQTNTEPHTIKQGRGIYGMRERARLAGGWLTAGSEADIPGGYLVTAFVPTAWSPTPTVEAEMATMPQQGTSTQ
ncbi:histidine kinase [Salinibacterium sp. TMP30]|uniref:sensor histidine kinase n=1 Tax=Salinibacterium sp. TMP30 TaxID=3138237 RepID=UPI003138C2FE